MLWPKRPARGLAGLPQSASGSGFIAASGFGGYTGLSTYVIDMGVSQWQDFGALGGIETSFTPSTAGGNVTVTYEYIPEPATMSLLGIGGLAMMKRRRRKIA